MKFEQERTNELIILKDGEKVASLINEDRVSSIKDFLNAKFIVDSCNKAETKIVS